jgi:hypothetical protein
MGSHPDHSELRARALAGATRMLARLRGHEQEFGSSRAIDDRLHDALKRAAGAAERVERVLNRESDPSSTKPSA